MDVEMLPNLYLPLHAREGVKGIFFLTQKEKIEEDLSVF